VILQASAFPYIIRRGNINYIPPHLNVNGASGLIDHMSKTFFAGACDCHVHIVGPTARFPQTVHGSYIARPAAVESLRAAAEPLGVMRFVIVQPSFYGTDNSCLFEALEQLGDLGRGVAVVDAALTKANILESYGRRGICGLRLSTDRLSWLSARTGTLSSRATPLRPREISDISCTRLPSLP